MSFECINNTTQALLAPYLGPHSIPSSSASLSLMAQSIPQFTDLITSLKDGVYSITYNRPTQMLDDFTRAITFASSSPDVRVVVVTGKGDFFSSGNDLSNFLKGDITPDALDKPKAMLVRIVEVFIECPKILIACVNGPAIGMGCTMLCHFDFVYSAKTAYFTTPFTELAQTPEFCSSYLFGQRLGWTKANEMLILGKRYTATDLKHLLITDVFDSAALALEHSNQVARKIASFPPECLLESKRLVVGRNRELLRTINKDEVEELGRRWASPELFDAVAKFMSRNKKANL